MQIFKREESIASLIVETVKQNIIEGTYEELVLDEYIKMTIGMPGLSEEEDVIEVESLKERMAELKCSFTIALLLKKEKTFNNIRI